jgi:hypothetical protein
MLAQPPVFKSNNTADTSRSATKAGRVTLTLVSHRIMFTLVFLECRDFDSKEIKVQTQFI